jgi:CBS domain-containing protein
VVDGDRVAGVISTTDLSSAGAAERHARTVRELMTSEVVSANPTTSVHKAAELMRENSIGSLPVLDNGKLVGIVTAEDLEDWTAVHRDHTRLQVPGAGSRKTVRPVSGGVAPLARP